MATKKENTQLSPPHSLLELAIKEKAGIEIITALIQREEEEKQRIAEKNYYQAKLNLQSELPIIKRDQVVTVADKDGKIIRYSYSSLENILRTIQPYCKKYGFSYRWEFNANDDRITCSCFLTHVDGFSEVATMSALRDTTENMNNIQSVGSTRTYLQRYTIASILGLAMIDEDNDGRTSSTSSKKKQSIPAPEPKKKQSIPAPEPKKNDKIELEFLIQAKEDKDDSSKT